MSSVVESTSRGDKGGRDEQSKERRWQIRNCYSPTVRAGYRQPSKVHTRTVGAMNWTGATSRVSLSRNVAVVFKLIFLL